MKKIKKKLLTWMLALAMCLGMCQGYAMTAQAAEPATWLVAPGVYDYDSSNGFSEGLLAVQDKNTQKWGYINTAGQLVIPCRYEDAEPFSDGAAAVDTNNGSAFIDREGKVLFSWSGKLGEIYPTNGRGVTSFHEGLTVAQSGAWSDARYGFMNKAGQLVVPCKYERVSDFSDGLAAVCAPGSQLWGYIDAAGNEVIPCQYKNALSFEGGYAKVQAADGTDRWMLIDKIGRSVIPEGYEFKSGNFLSNSGVVSITKDGMYYLLDENGGIVGPVNAWDFTDGLSWSGIELFDTAGRKIFEIDSQSISKRKYLGDGYSGVKMSAGCGLVDRDGNLTMLPGDMGLEWILGEDTIYSEGLVQAYIRDSATGSKKKGFVNMAGEIAVPCTYSWVGLFSGGAAPVQNSDGKRGLVDATGAEVLPLQYGNIGAVKGATGLFLVGNYSNFGLVAAPTSYAANGAVVNYVAKAKVDNAVQENLANETLGGDYRAEITRAQIASVMVKLYEAAGGQPAPAAGATPFTDIDDQTVTQAKELGLIEGLPDGRFIPDMTVPREQVAVMLSGVAVRLNQALPVVQTAKFEPEGSMRKAASIEETLATAAQILKKIKK